MKHVTLGLQKIPARLPVLLCPAVCNRNRELLIEARQKEPRGINILARCDTFPFSFTPICRFARSFAINLRGSRMHLKFN